jgi:hypothetical protein
MPKRITIAWSKDANDSDYAAAETYLSLVMAPKVAARLVKELRKAPIRQLLARDILRAAGISPFGTTPSEEQRQKILAKKPLAPLLLARAEREMRLIVADGYHRVSTVYAFDEAAAVPCKLVAISADE